MGALDAQADPDEKIEGFTTVDPGNVVAVQAAGYAGDRPPEQVLSDDKTPRFQPVNTIEQ